jgi:protein involved in polysaccharide export with SLBB domain
VQIAGEVVNPGIYGFVDGKDLSYYVDMAGGTTDSADFAIIHYPEGLSERANFGLFRLDPDIPDGSSIVVHKIKPPPPEPVEKEKGPSFYDVTKEVFAIMASALTIVVMANQLK